MKNITEKWFAVSEYQTFVPEFIFDTKEQAVKYAKKTNDNNLHPLIVVNFKDLNELIGKNFYNLYY